MTSENGWPLISTADLDSSPIPGTNIVPIPGVRAGDVATLLHWVGSQFNQRVAPLYNPGCWGWNAPTPIPGTTIYSNHCSGTAIDFNAPSFPWTLRTMTDAQRTACRQIVEETEYVVIWGGDFTTRIDEMHFEINGSAEDVARIVRKIGATMTPEALAALYQVATNRYIDGSDKFVQDYTGKDPLSVIMDLKNSAANIEMRTKAANYDNVMNALHNAYRRLETETRPSGDESSKQLAALKEDLKKTLDKYK